MYNIQLCSPWLLTNKITTVVTLKINQTHYFQCCNIMNCHSPLVVFKQRYQYNIQIKKQKEEMQRVFYSPG